MRFFRLLQLAQQAEVLRWKRIGHGYAVKAGYGAAAAVFAVLLLVMLHIAALFWLGRERDPVSAALIVAAVDLVLLAIFGLLAARAGEDRIALEARQVRDDALHQVGENTAKLAMITPLLRSQNAKKGLIGAAVTAMVVGLLARR